MAKGQQTVLGRMGRQFQSPGQTGRAILQFTERTFNPDMLAKGENPSVSLKLGRFSWWVRQHFGSAMMRKVTDISRFDAETMKAPTSTISVPAKFVETFLAVAHFCIKEDPLSNRAVPTNRIKKIWGMVKDGAAWNQKYFQVVRDRLNRMGVISIFDRQHHVGKAWRWSVGDSFPEHSWKEEQRKFKEEHRLPAELAKSFEEIAANIVVITTTYIIPYTTTRLRFQPFPSQMSRSDLLPSH